MPNAVDRIGHWRCLGGAPHWLEGAKSSQAAWINFQLSISQFWDGKKWIDWMPYDYGIIGKVFLLDKEGKKLEKGFHRLKEVMGWDGNPDTLDSDDWITPPCSIEVEDNEHKGRIYKQVKWINAYEADPNRVGGVSTASQPAIVSRLVNELGPSIRALFGGNVSTPKPPPPTKPQVLAPPAVKPITYPAIGVPSVVPVAVPEPGTTRDAAWEAVKAFAFKHELEPRTPQRLWQEKYAELFVGRDEASLNGAEWLRLQEEVIKATTPF